MHRPFLEIALAVISATFLGIIAKFFRQPIILAYVVVGILLGPTFLDIFQTPNLIETLSSLGIAFLLFLIGLELDLRRLREISIPAFTVGIGQILFTGGIGYVLVRLFSFSALSSLYIAVAITFSSTIIVVKLLSEKQDIDSWYGRLTIGMLIVQDLFAVVFLVVLSTFQQSETAPLLLFGTILFSLVKGILLFLLAITLSHVVIRPLFSRLGRNPELLFLASISWCFLFATTSLLIGFSIEIGAFFAGLSLAILPYHLEVASRVRSLRDFFLTLFFVALGSQFLLSDIQAILVPFFVLTLFILIGNPLIVIVLMGVLGYKKRIGFFIAVTTAQISEFSIILMGLGRTLGHVPEEAVFLVTLLGITTITISTYFILYTEQLYRFFSPVLSLFERKTKLIHLGREQKDHEQRVIVFGYHRMGTIIVKTLEKLKYPFLIIDFNPKVIQSLLKSKKPCLYGDAEDQEFLETLHLDTAKMIISTIPDFNTSLRLITIIRKKKISTPLVVTSQNAKDTLDLYAAGAHYVIFPQYLSAQHFALLLEDEKKNQKHIQRERARHIAALARAEALSL